MRRRAGFTLIELMIVIAIIAIIAAIAIPNLLEARKHGNEAAVSGSLRTLATAQAVFRNDDPDGDQLVDYGSLAELRAANLIDEALSTGVKHGYYFKDEIDGENYAVNAVPATAHTGSRNFRMTCGANPPEDCEIRESNSGIPGEASPLVPDTEGNAAGPVPPTSVVTNCGAAPMELVPMTPEKQTAANAAVEGMLMTVVGGLAQNFGAMAGDLSHTLFATTPGTSVAPDQAVLRALDSDNDDRLGFDEIAVPFGQFSAGDAIAGVQNSYGSCQAACFAGGGTNTSCETFCSESIVMPGQVESMLEGLASALFLLLDLGMACEEAPPTLPLSAFSGDPLAFVSEAFGFASKVPLLAPPLVAALALVLLGVGLRRARRGTRTRP